MNNFPFFRFGYPRYYNYYAHHYNKPTKSFDEPDVESSLEPNLEAEHKKIPPKYNLEEPILEFFGIKLYLDDIIIICLLFLLYTEGVKDEFLFIVLILLLLG